MSARPALGRSADPVGSRTDRSAALYALDAELTELETLPYGQRVGAGPRAAAAEQRAAALDAEDLQMRARLIQAVAIGRAGRTPASARLIRDVNRWAQEHQHRYLLARSHYALSELLRQLGDGASALANATRSLELTLDSDPVGVRLDHQLALAVALARTGDHSAARARMLDIERDPAAVDAPWILIMALNNLSYMNYEFGRPAEALATAERMVATAAACDSPLLAAQVDTMGRALLVCGRAAESIAFIGDWLSRHGGITGPDEIAENLLTLAEGQRVTGRLDDAHATLDACLEQCTLAGLADVRARLHEQRAEAYAAQERFREAFEEYKLFAAATAAARNKERDGQAKIAQAVFETAEARRDSERFRKLSLHDPLTGLFNRRFMDERMPGLVAAACERGEPLTVALVDLDHFKRINDTFSHAVGDGVLVEVARLLEDRVPADGFAVRLGGEEFLLVLPGVDGADGVGRCEGLRSALRGYDWSALAPGLTVTASIGVAAVAGDADSQALLLRRTDACLYRAKHGGRDRVVGA
ncbi:hypothetical protein GCM10010123_15650 [Pilimelia anulata]|uniref:GGDEF domain-containing protein n=1 Tax=Pilimelia anulata TaxID=53371 RepID=A0A8J3F9I3_9ACTN|nr:GGDEF domain-containing protein [Pilimelia anulata]GGJ86945.1 hypothetical protein GCM10010123_15650 [Pilimelia anulata]